MKRAVFMILSLSAMLAAIVCIVLPMMAFAKAPGWVQGSVASADLWSEETKQVAGPLLMIVVAGWVLFRLIRRGLPSWFWLAPAFAAAAFTTTEAGDYAHDFSHVLFSECSSRYGEVIGFSIWGSALALLAGYLVLRGDDLSNRHYRKNLFSPQESEES